MTRKYRKNDYNGLKQNFFKYIKDKKTAYWLGFLLADGCVQKRSEKSYVFYLSLSIKDMDTMKKFCKDINFKYKNISTRERTMKNGKKFKQCEITIANKDFCENLINSGCIPQKTNRLQIPHSIKLDKNILLAFLLGFFDGDGTISKTDLGTRVKHQPSIYSICFDFMNEIRTIFKIENKIRHSNKSRDSKIDNNGIITKKPLYILCLGTDLYCRMLSNYKYSMNRKRFNFKSHKKSSIYLGVSFCNTNKTWVAIYKNPAGNWKHIGKFDLELDAAKAYDSKMVETYGINCSLNFNKI